MQESTFQSIKQEIITVRDEDKGDIIPIARRFEALGYKIYATRSTARVLNDNGVKAIRTNKIEKPPRILWI